MRWRVAPGVRDLALTVSGPDGEALWTDTFPSPATALDGPVLRAGEGRVTVAGNIAGRPFTFERPFHVGPAAELVPGPFGPPLTVGAHAVERAPWRHRRGGTPVWPFAAAALLLCAEWLWRRRVGLR